MTSAAREWAAVALCLALLALSFMLHRRASLAARSRHSDLCVAATAGTLTFCVGRADAAIVRAMLDAEASTLFTGLDLVAVEADANGHVVVRLKLTRARQDVRRAFGASARALRDRLRELGVAVRVVGC